jgi:lysophospholipase L1-like esterase
VSGSSAVFARLLLVVVSCALVAVAGEVVLRRLDPPRAVFYEPDAAALYRLRPGARERYHYPWLPPGEQVEVAVNSRGFRGPELPPRKVGRRVVVYGDSFVEARSTRIEDTFAARLQAALRARAPAPLDVVNAGVSGYGPDQVLARLEGRALDLEPDLVVLVLYAGNDFGDLVRDQLYRLDSAGRLERGAPVLAEPLRAAFELPGGLQSLATVRAASRLWAELTASRRAAAANAAASTDALLRECEREYADARDRTGRVTNLFRDHYDADVAAQPRWDCAVYKRRLMAAVLAAASRTTAARSVPLVLVAVPAGSDVSETDPHRVDASRFPEYRPEALTDALEEAATAARIPVVNLFGPFRASNASPLYHAIDGHWNAAAQAMAADLVADRITAEGFLR